MHTKNYYVHEIMITNTNTNTNTNNFHQYMYHHTEERFISNPEHEETSLDITSGSCRFLAITTVHNFFAPLHS
jgi:hypothetical protein